MLSPNGERSPGQAEDPPGGVDPKHIVTGLQWRCHYISTTNSQVCGISSGCLPTGHDLVFTRHNHCCVLSPSAAGRSHDWRLETSAVRQFGRSNAPQPSLLYIHRARVRYMAAAPYKDWFSFELIKTSSFGLNCILVCEHLLDGFYLILR